jgi:hypothetical protein
VKIVDCENLQFDERAAVVRANLLAAAAREQKHGSQRRQAWMAPEAPAAAHIESPHET